MVTRAHQPYFATIDPSWRPLGFWQWNGSATCRVAHFEAVKWPTNVCLMWNSKDRHPRTSIIACSLFIWSLCTSMQAKQLGIWIPSLQKVALSNLYLLWWVPVVARRLGDCQWPMVISFELIASATILLFCMLFSHRRCLAKSVPSSRRARRSSKSLTYTRKSGNQSKGLHFVVFSTIERKSTNSSLCSHQAQATGLSLLLACRVLIGLAQSFGTPACYSCLARGLDGPKAFKRHSNGL